MQKKDSIPLQLSPNRHQTGVGNLASSAAEHDLSKTRVGDSDTVVQNSLTEPDRNGHVTKGTDGVRTDVIHAGHGNETGRSGKETDEVRFAGKENYDARLTGKECDDVSLTGKDTDDVRLTDKESDDVRLTDKETDGGRFTSKETDDVKLTGKDTDDVKLTGKDTDDVTLTGKESGEEDEVIEIEHVKEQLLIYGVNDNPPWRLLFLFTLQQGLLSVSTALSVSVLVTEVVCGRDDGEFKAQVLSATFFMVGLSTFSMSTIGIRLPIFQGPASSYIVPLLALSALPEWKCPSQQDLALYYANNSVNATGGADSALSVPKELIYLKIQQLSGSLMLAGGLHCLIGITGLVGFLLRFIGPVTIVPAITLVGLFIYKVIVRFSETCWGVAIFVASSGLILSLYLSKRSTPIPAWSRQRGLHIKWFPLHQVFAVLIAIIIGWLVSAVLTYFDLLSTDRNSVQFYARTDTQLHVIHSTPWLSFPYPGRFGFPSFHAGVFISFFLATLLSVLDSIGDYRACARMCEVIDPPVWAVNRGIAVEGLMSFLSGALGAGHATVSYGSNIGAMGLTKVASRRVFQLVGLMYVALAIVSKVGAVIITVPYSVLGGTQIMTIGIFIGIVLSNLQYVDLTSTRNMAIIGISLLTGLMMPYWVQNTPDPIQSGNAEVDRMVQIILSNPVCVAGFLACFLDNTIPGTLKERGIAINDRNDDDEKEDDGFKHGMEVYALPWLPSCIQRSSLSKIFRICPGNVDPSDKEKGKLLAQPPEQL